MDSDSIPDGTRITASYKSSIFEHVIQTVQASGVSDDPWNFILRRHSQHGTVVTMRNDSKENAAHLRTKWLGREVGTPASYARSDVQISAPRPDILTVLSFYSVPTEKLRVGASDYDKTSSFHTPSTSLFTIMLPFNAMQTDTERFEINKLKQLHISCQYCARRTVFESFTMYIF